MSEAALAYVLPLEGVLPVNQYRLLLTLASHLAEDAEMVAISRARLSALTDLTETTVRRNLQRLIDQGYLAVEQVQRPERGHCPNQYWFPGVGTPSHIGIQRRLAHTRERRTVISLAARTARENAEKLRRESRRQRLQRAGSF